MKLITSVLTVLVYVNAVYSAAMREGSEDLLRFLNDAFKMNTPPGDLQPTKFTDIVLETEKPLHPTDPTAECKAPEIVNVAEFSNATPKPNLAEITGIDEERSTESSNTDSGLTDRTSAEDSIEVESYKKLQLRSKDTDTQKMLQEHYNSAESISIDRTDLDTLVMEGTKKNPIKTTVMTDISSQEMDKHVKYVRYRSLRTIENYSTEITGAPERQELNFIKQTHLITQTSTGQTNLNDQSDQPQETDKLQQRRAVDVDSPEVVDAASEELAGGRVSRQTLRLISDQSTIKTTCDDQTNRTEDKEKYNSSNSSQGIADNATEMSGQKPSCAETSAEHPRGKNNSKVDQEIQKDTMSYQNQLRKINPSKRLRTSKNPREQLDYDSPERVNSELLDNSSERLDEHVSVTL